MATSGNVPVSFGEFAGLDLRSGSPPGALDAFNVDLDSPGRIASRPGYRDLRGADSASSFDGAVFMFPGGGGATFSLFANRSTTLDYFTDVGSAAAGSTTLAGENSVRIVPLGTPSSTLFFIADSAAATRQCAADGTFTAGTALATVDGVSGRAMPKGRELVVQPADNRLVAAGTVASGGPHGVASTTSHVWFSDPGAPTTWDTDNYVMLTPGDGEDITAAVAWGQQVFVFKRSRLFVFYGNSQDADGNPIFNYRTVELPSRVGARGRFPLACASPDGVYFVAEDGVWLTTGGPPIIVSDPIRPVFLGGAGMHSLGPFGTTPAPIATEDPGLAWNNGRLYLRADTGMTGGGSTTLWVHDPAEGYWLPWSVATNGIAAVTEMAGGGVVGPVLALGNRLGLFDKDETTDDGTSITSRYRAGFDDYGSDLEKEVREWGLWGTGTVAFKSSKDYGSLSSATNVTLGTSPAIAQGRFQKNPGGMGTMFSWELSSVSGGAWSVQRVVPYLRGDGAPGRKTS